MSGVLSDELITSREDELALVAGDAFGEADSQLVIDIILEEDLTAFNDLILLIDGFFEDV